DRFHLPGILMSNRVYHKSHHTPHGKISKLSQVNILVTTVFRYQKSRSEILVKTTYQQFAIEYRYNDFSIRGFDRTVHDQYVIVKNAGVFHGIAPHPEKISGRLVSHQFLVEVDTTLHVVISSRTKTRCIGCADIM